jgi:hypothetical protein
MIKTKKEILKSACGKGGPTSVMTPLNPGKKDLGSISSPGSSSAKTVLPGGNKTDTQYHPPMIKDPFATKPIPTIAPGSGKFPSKPAQPVAPKPMPMPKPALPIKPTPVNPGDQQKVQTPVNPVDKYKQFPGRGHGYGRGHERQRIMHDRINQKKKEAESIKKLLTTGFVKTPGQNNGLVGTFNGNPVN